MDNKKSSLIFGGLIPYFTTGQTPSPGMKHYHTTITWFKKFKLTLTLTIKD